MKVVVLILAGLLVSVITAKSLAAPAPRPVKAAKTEPPKITIPSFKEVRWRVIFEWLAESTGKRVVTKIYPEGTFTSDGPADKEYPIADVIAQLNTALLHARQGKSYFLVQQEGAIWLIPATKTIDPRSVPCISLTELKCGRRGETELVTIVIPLRDLVAVDIASQVQKMLGRFASVVPMSTNIFELLIVTDTIGNLQQIVDMLQSAG